MLTVEERVKNFISSQLNIKVEDLKNESLLAEDLGADSLDLIEITMSIEEEFNGNIPDEDSEKIKTVGDVVKYVEAKIAEAKSNHFGDWKE